jgi:hypothetical protein
MHKILKILKILKKSKEKFRFGKHECKKIFLFLIKYFLNYFRSIIGILDTTLKNNHV